jgi:uncharacterized surface protein with fasciclin (FAS1) repeats
MFDDQHTDTAKPKNIVETTNVGADFSVLAAAVRAAELVDTLASAGPFTVFAPSDAAFAKLPRSQIDQLFKPENKRRLTSLMAHHILAGQLTTADLRDRVRAADGHLTLRTVDGDTIEFEDCEDRIYIVDQRGGRATLTVSDLLQSNGVIHVMDSVLAPQAW